MGEGDRLATGSGADPEIIKRVLNTDQLAMFDPEQFDAVMDGLDEVTAVCMSVWVVVGGERRSLGDPRTWDVPHQQWMSISAIDEIARERARRGLWAE